MGSLVDVKCIKVKRGKVLSNIRLVNIPTGLFVVEFGRTSVWVTNWREGEDNFNGEMVRAAKFFFLPWFCRFITSHPVSQPSVSYSALNFDLIRSIHRQLAAMVLGKVRLLLSCGKISLAVVEQAWKNITKHKQLVNKLRLTFHDQVKILRQNF